METYDWLFDDPPIVKVVQTEEPLDEPVWTTKKGQKIPLSKMTNSHICNCINMLKDRGHRTEYEDKWLYILRNEYLKRLNNPIQSNFNL